jgi:hypothetical protein
MDERFTHDMAPVLGKVALCVAAMNGELGGSQPSLQKLQGSSLVDSDSLGSGTFGNSSSNTAWDLLCCGELSRGNALTPILIGPLVVHTDLPHAFFADGVRQCNFSRGAFVAPFALESQRTIRLKRLAQSARELRHFRELLNSPEDMVVPSRPEQPPRSAPATLGTQSLAAMMETLMGRGNKPMPRQAANAIAYQLARAIVHANGLGVCHRDICPANIMIRLPSVTIELTGWALLPSMGP